MEADIERKPRRKILVLSLIAFIGVLAAFWFLFIRTPYGDVWAKTTVPYDPTCQSGCTAVNQLDGGQSHGASEIAVFVNPDVDDPIAQWGDCLQSIFTCVEAQSDPFQPGDQKASTVKSCVAASSCPAACIERFSRRSTGGAADVEAALDDIFIDKAGWCVPREGQE